MIPESYHADTGSLPWAECWADDPAIRLKLLMADVEGARFAVRMGFAPGTQVFPHKHTGEVHAFTLAGRWNYLEYPGSPDNVAGSYLYEPPGSTHTLKVADDAGEETDVVFVIYGALLHLDDRGNPVAITDAASVIEEYGRRLRAQGVEVPRVPIGGAMGYRAI
ncbi:MAG: 2,4'-dihydroxyacetophenone dioxygenase family protein [Alteraurantiacibacter sp.]|nr:2,4'-dihydroxyacetophenone dioxygenase family protein [Alteraurantiacibacter sp.]